MASEELTTALSQIISVARIDLTESHYRKETLLPLHSCLLVKMVYFIQTVLWLRLFLLIVSMYFFSVIITYKYILEKLLK